MLPNENQETALTAFNIGKRNTFQRNIISITGSETLTAALDDWTVLRVIDLLKSQPMSSCELCGTRFRRGALMRHTRHKATVTIGGTCAEIIRRKAFGSSTEYQTRRDETWNLFKKHYGDIISQGAWITWLIRNAPPRLAPIVADLQFLGAVRSDEDLRALIRFHDATRLYPVSALISERQMLTRAGVAKIPRYLTLNEARRIMNVLSTRSKVLNLRSQHFWRQHLRPFLSMTVDGKAAWRALSKEEQQTVTALAALSEEKRIGSAASFFDQFTFVDSHPHVPQFIWNPQFGLALIERHDYKYNGIAHVILWGCASKAKRTFALSYFRTPSSQSRSVVKALERLAFGQCSQDSQCAI